jgi:tellurite resistance protein TehA-like permease
MLQAIVTPEFAKGGTRRNVILATVVPVVMLGIVWGLFDVPMGDLSKYKSLADAAYSILPIGFLLYFFYLTVKSTRLRNELIQKLYHALSSMDASEADTKTTDD